MITQQEFNALMELLQRTPASRAEMLWVQVFMTRLQAAITQESRQRAAMQPDAVTNTSARGMTNEEDGKLPEEA